MLAIVVEAIVDETTPDATMEIGPVTMEIMPMLWRWRSKAQDDDGHIMSRIFVCM